VRAARVVVAVAAVLLVAWLAVMERNTRLQAQGVAEIPKAERVRSGARATVDFTRARFLNPDRTPYLLLGSLYINRGLRAFAASAANVVLEHEPQNVLAWRLLLESTQGRDRASAQRASRALHRLDPRDFPD
jgi:hypothetical protein